LINFSKFDSTKRIQTIIYFKVQFCCAWNLHEEIPGQYDFDTGMLNMTDFLTAIKETEMFAIVRVGPFICAEWELGGFPAWLLRDPKMNLRTNYKPFLDAVEKYYNKLTAVVKKFQFSSNGGPIIALQIENEFGGYGNTITNHNDAEYLKALENNLRKNGFNELLFTSDTEPTKQGSLPGL
jgi:beta-galactosidase